MRSEFSYDGSQTDPIRQSGTYYHRVLQMTVGNTAVPKKQKSHKMRRKGKMNRTKNLTKIVSFSAVILVMVSIGSAGGVFQEQM